MIAKLVRVQGKVKLLGIKSKVYLVVDVLTPGIETSLDPTF